MASPLGLIPDNINFKKTKASTKYNRYTLKFEPETNSVYEKSLYSSDSLSYFPKTSKKSDGNIEREIQEVETNPHSNDVYDIRTSSIIDWSQKQSNAMALFDRDFAYLRLLGVYPNNRLIICRKFGTPVGSDLSTRTDLPVSSVITWKPPGEDFFDISFGEKWKSADASFKTILNDIGGDFRMGSLGDAAGGGLGVVPLPGFTEIWQRQIMQKLGIIGTSSAGIIPAGSPNLIKEAQQRVLVGADEEGSGLDCTISIKVTAEYEQKFIGGLDPTKSFYDIIGNIAKFGTQESIFYLSGGDGNISDTARKLLDNLKNNPRQAITDFLTGVVNSLVELKNSIVESLGLGDKKKPSNDDVVNGDVIPDGGKIIDGMIKGLLSAITGIVKKFEIRILGVINALTGQSSGTYHVSLGNPRRPLFCSGDMIVKEVNIKFGETLAFNDLPSRITAEFTMVNARPLGLQEIMSRFMQGQGRSYKAGPSSWQEAGDGNDFVPKPDNNIKPIGTPETSTPVGGTPVVSSGSDASHNETSTKPSSQSFSVGSGQESNTDKPIDPETVRNTTELSAVPDTKPKGLNPDPTAKVAQQGNGTNTAGLPDSGKTGESKPMSDDQISKSSDSDLINRSVSIDDEMKNTPESDTKKRDDLSSENNKINTELSDREDKRALNIDTPPTNNGTA